MIIEWLRLRQRMCVPRLDGIPLHELDLPVDETGFHHTGAELMPERIARL